VLLRNPADRRVIAYALLTTALFAAQWIYGSNWVLYPVYLVLSVAVTVIAHNHNHVPVFRGKRWNAAMDYWLTIFYGFPAFAWIPTHNMNHHALNNREGDYTITYRWTEHNHLLMLLSYPTMSSYYQQKPIRDYVKLQWKQDRSYAWFCLSQYAVLIAFVAGGFLLDWHKALYYIVIPQQFGLFAVLVFNYIQHVHTDEESKYDHSRNFLGWINAILFNNGYHTVHHDRAGMHWSALPEAHAKVADKISPVLQERSFLWYMVRSYIVGAFWPKYRTQSMRLARIAAERNVPVSDSISDTVSEHALA
jgi:beta-carotene hydroxylase